MALGGAASAIARASPKPTCERSMARQPLRIGSAGGASSNQEADSSRAIGTGKILLVTNCETARALLCNSLLLAQLLESRNAKVLSAVRSAYLAVISCVQISHSRPGTWD